MLYSIKICAIKGNEFQVTERGHWGRTVCKYRLKITDVRKIIMQESITINRIEEIRLRWCWHII